MTPPIKMNTKKKLVVFDLNGVLIKREFDPEKTIQLKTGDKRIGCHAVSKLQQIDFNELGKYYDIAVWSSMAKKNIDKLISYTFGTYEKKIKFVFNQEQCTVNGYVPGTTKPLFMKNVDKITKTLPVSYNDIIIVDDSPEKIETGSYGCHLQPKDYEDTDLFDHLVFMQIQRDLEGLMTMA